MNQMCHFVKVTYIMYTQIHDNKHYLQITGIFQKITNHVLKKTFVIIIIIMQISDSI